MKKIFYSFIIVMMTMVVATHGATAKNAAQPLQQADDVMQQNQDNGPEALYLSFGTVGGRVICDGMDSKVCSGGKYIGTVAETFASGHDIPNDLPWTIENRDYSVDIYLFDKDNKSMQDISAIYANGILRNCELPDRDAKRDMFVTFYVKKDTKIHESTIFSLPMNSKDTAGKPCESRLTFYDLRFCHCYAIVDITKPADSPVNIDSIFSEISFASGNDCFEGNTALTESQMNKDGDGFEVLTAICDRLAVQSAGEDKERFESVKGYLDDVAEQYKQTFGYYPASTEKGKAERKQQTHEHLQGVKQKVRTLK